MSSDNKSHISDPMVQLTKSQFEALVSQNTLLKSQQEICNEIIAEQRADIVALVNVFSKFEVLFNGKSLAGAIPTIMKLINDKNQLAAIGEIVPIIQKYEVNNG